MTDFSKYKNVSLSKDTYTKLDQLRKVIVPKMDTEMINSAGYRALLDVIDLLQPGAKEEFIKYNEKDKGSIH